MNFIINGEILADDFLPTVTPNLGPLGAAFANLIGWLQGIGLAIAIGAFVVALIGFLFNLNRSEPSQLFQTIVMVALVVTFILSAVGIVAMFMPGGALGSA
jgi:hypothetical protein